MESKNSTQPRRTIRETTEYCVLLCNCLAQSIDDLDAAAKDTGASIAEAVVIRTESQGHVAVKECN